MKNIKYIFGAILIIVVIFLFIPFDGKSSNWKEFSDLTYDAALQNNQKMILDFYADWCIPCKELDKNTLNDKNFISASKNFLLLKVDMTKTLSDKTEEISKRFDIKGLPTILIYNSKGEEIERITGFIGPKNLINVVKSIK